MDHRPLAPDARAALKRDGPSKDTQGLLSGTPVLTMDGALPVEHLTPGDRIITRDRGLSVLGGLRAFSAWLAPIRVAAGALGHGRPEADLEMPPGTVVLLRDWRARALFGAPAARVPIRRLVDREHIAAQPARLVQVLALRFAGRHVVYAAGVEVAVD